jgi:hypothetical protein
VAAPAVKGIHGYAADSYYRPVESLLYIYDLNAVDGVVLGWEGGGGGGGGFKG